jgi:Scramblase
VELSIKDASDREVARITKTFEGDTRTLITTADHYVVQIHEELPEPLRSLVVASTLCVDTALKQDKRGFN